MKIELLDIFQGFSECTTNKYFAAIKQIPSSWEQELKRKLMTDINLFKELAQHTNKEISAFACNIVDDFTNH